MQSKTIPCFGNILQALQSNLSFWLFLVLHSFCVSLFYNFIMLWNTTTYKQEVSDEFSKNIESLKLVGGPLNLQSRWCRKGSTWNVSKKYH